jgi:hypothetical protein
MDSDDDTLSQVYQNNDLNSIYWAKRKEAFLRYQQHLAMINANERAESRKFNGKDSVQLNELRRPELNDQIRGGLDHDFKVLSVFERNYLYASIQQKQMKALQGRVLEEEKKKIKSCSFKYALNLPLLIHAIVSHPHHRIFKVFVLSLLVSPLVTITPDNERI